MLGAKPVHKSLYSRPAKPMRLTVTPRRQTARIIAAAPKPLYVDRATECHITPCAIAALMVDYLGPQTDGLTLEPSAGTGALIAALVAAGYAPARICAVERHNSLAARLSGDMAAQIYNRCFLDFAREHEGGLGFSRIVMNPPFRAVKAHIKAALSLLAEDSAVMVALVPITFEHDRAEPLQTLPRDTFSTAQVATKLIRFET